MTLDPAVHARAKALYERRPRPGVLLDPQSMFEALREALAAVFEVASDRIEIRWQVLEFSEARTQLAYGILLDGAQAPQSWMDFAADIHRAADELVAERAAARTRLDVLPPPGTPSHRRCNILDRPIALVLSAFVEAPDAMAVAGLCLLWGAAYVLLGWLR